MPGKRFSIARGGNIPKMIAAVLFMAAVLLMPGAAARGAARGVELCLSSVIPPLFALLFAVILLTECGVSARLSRLLAPVCVRLFGLSGCAGAALLASLIGGYPAGAKTAVSLYEKGMISRGEARRTVMFCFGAGPAFILGTAGRLLPGHGALLLLAVQPAVIVICGVITKHLSRGGSGAGGGMDEEGKKADSRSFSECVVSAADSTASALLNICVFVVLFSSVKEMLTSCGASACLERLIAGAGASDTLSEAALPVLLEVTGGIMPACREGLPAAAFALGFGGLAVHMQIYGICRDTGIDHVRFTLMRLLGGLLSAALTAALSRLLPAAVSAAAPGYEAQMRSSGPAGAVTLFIMCVMLVLCSEDKMNPAGRIPPGPEKDR